MIGVRSGLLGRRRRRWSSCSACSTAARGVDPRGGWSASRAGSCWALRRTAAPAGAGVDGRWGPADVVTLSRATLACGVAALVAEPSSAQPAGAALVVARRGRAGPRRGGRPGGEADRDGVAFGARLDGEADAFLMLVLSVLRRAGGRRLGARDRGGPLRVRGGRLGAALDARPAPPRYWRKVVTAVAGIALVVRGSDVGPAAATYAALGDRARRCSPSPSAATSGGCGAAGRPDTGAGRIGAAVRGGSGRHEAGRAHGVRRGVAAAPGWRPTRRASSSARRAS